jgi:hypothetical protein
MLRNTIFYVVCEGAHTEFAETLHEDSFALDDYFVEARKRVQSTHQTSERPVVQSHKLRLFLD